MSPVLGGSGAADGKARALLYQKAQSSFLCPPIDEVDI
jgi:hypothetical protein